MDAAMTSPGFYVELRFFKGTQVRSKGQLTVAVQMASSAALQLLCSFGLGLGAAACPEPLTHSVKALVKGSSHHSHTVLALELSCSLTCLASAF